MLYNIIGEVKLKIIKEIIPYAVIFLIVILIRSFVVTPVIVSGTSMDSTLKDGEILLLNKFDKTYDRYDIVVFDYQGSKLVKRIIGLPGETVEYKDGILYINGRETEDNFSSITRDYKMDIEVIPDGYYFVMGDNRNNSSDSRIIGLIDEKSINGTTTISLWPIKIVK